MSNPRIAIPVPEGKRYLPYQLSAIRYCLGARGTLIADEMGLGKTVTAIGVINTSPQNKAAIIAPAGLVINWRNELREWLVHPNALDLYVKVFTYHEAEKLQPGQYDTFIIDEAHYIKNPLSKRCQVITNLCESPTVKRVLLLTGTPMDNRPVELWPLLRIVAPKVFDPPHLRLGVLSPEQKKSHPGEGPGFWAFCKEYCGLKRNRFLKRGIGAASAWDFSGATNIEALNAKLRKHCMVRRLKKDVLTQLPPKRHQVIVLPAILGLPPDDDLYPDLNEDNYYQVINELQPGKVKFEEWSKRRHEQALKKLDTCLRVIGDALDESRKIIIFAHHADVIRKLEECIGAEMDTGDYAVAMTGQTPIKERQKIVELFQNDPKCRVFIGSIGAAGVGFTLTAASHVIFVELDPVPGRMAQAIDRAHRIGTKATMILIWYLVADKTLCARMAKILVKKQQIIGKVLA